MSEWVENPLKARAEACVKPRHPGAPPHWLRCEHFRGDERCIKGDRHADNHEPPK